MPNASERIVEVLNHFLPEEGDFMPAQVAEKVRAYLDEQDPDLRDAWLQEMFASWLREALTKILRSRRSRVHRRIRADAFNQALRSAGMGNTEPLSAFTRVTFRVDEANTRRRLGDMTGADHVFVADDYDRRGQSNLLLAELHRALAREVGDRRTSQVITEDEYANLYRSITGQNPS